MKQFRILLADDDERIIESFGARLKSEGYEIGLATDGLHFLEQARAGDFDMIILEATMPRLDGIEAVRELRTFSVIPIIIISAQGDDRDAIQGLSLGADDYMSKPINPEELLARIEAIRRRLETHEKCLSPDIYIKGNVRIDFTGRVLTVDGKDVRLTRIEWRILIELNQRAGRVMLYQEIISLVWGHDKECSMQLLRTWMSRLREKLKQGADNPEVIISVPRSGYMIGRENSLDQV